MNEPKRLQFEIQLNSIDNITSNPTYKEVEFIIHDFEINHNNSIISKDVATLALDTLKNMPILAVYYEKDGSNPDALGGHGAYISTDRNGNLDIKTSSIAIGTFTDEAYIDTIMVNGVEKEVVKGKGVLWTRYNDIIGLLQEWINQGVSVKSSMEILYNKYLFEDGVEHILNYWYEGHCLLNSSQRGNYAPVLPAYDSSQLIKLVAEAIKKENSEEGEKMERFQKVFELSHSDVRSLLYQVLDPTLTEGTYSWIADVYDSYFVVELYSEEEGSNYFKFNYTKNDASVSIDFESKAEVALKRDWVEVTQVQQMETQLNEVKVEKEQLETQVSELTTQLNEVNTTVETLTTEKETLSAQLNEVTTSLESVKGEKETLASQFNEASEKLTTLHSQVEEMKEYKEKFEQEQFEKALSEKKDFYSAKFSAVNAKEKFESEEVQELLKKVVFENEEGLNAKLSLNSMLVDLVQVKIDNENTGIREFASRQENLLPSSDDFDSKYK